MAFKIITTSSLIPRNGIDTLIEACGLLPKDFDWELTIAGDGPMMNDLRKMAVGKVRFLGRVTNDRIPGLLKKSDIFVRPSRFEGFGSSFIEAMAVGVPVVGTPVGGITDFITPEETGLLVPPDDPKRLATAIARLANDEKLYQKLKIRARDLVREKYNWDKIALKVYEEMKGCLRE